MPERWVRKWIFILRELHEKYLGKEKNFYLVFVDLQEAIDQEINGGVSENQMAENGLPRFYSEYRGILEVELESMTFLGMVFLFKQDCIWVQC